MSILHSALKITGVVTAVAGSAYLVRKCYLKKKARIETYKAEQTQVGYALKLLRDSIKKELNLSPHVGNDYEKAMWRSVKAALKKDIFETPLEQLEILRSWAKEYDQKLRNRKGTEL